MRTSVATGLIVAGAYFVMSALPALADESATVNATVSVTAPCVQLVMIGNQTAPPTLNFGTVAFGAQSPPRNNVGIKNCGTADEDVYVKGTSATTASSSSLWTLTNINTSQPGCQGAGINKYSVYVQGVTLVNGGLSYTTVTLSTSDQKVLRRGPDTTGNGTQPTTAVLMPCSGSGGAGETMDFQIIYTASL